MAYTELVNVATGVKAQLEACLTALDPHGERVSELVGITTHLELAAALCEEIIKRGQNEDTETTSTVPASPIERSLEKRRQSTGEALAS